MRQAGIRIMSAIFDIQPAVHALIQGTDVVKSRGLPPGTNRFDAGDSNGIFEGTVPAGATLSGEESLLVDGNAVGTAGSACSLHATRSLLVTGDMRHARVSAGSLHVAGNVRNAQIQVSGKVVVGGDMRRSHLMLGAFEASKRRIDEHRHDISRMQEQRAGLDRSINQDEKRLDRSCKATRVPLNFNVSRIVIQEQQRIRVNLSTVYSSIGDKPPDKLKKALDVFFTKGIIGFLAKTNRKYIAGNPAREKVFMQLLKALRGLVLQVFERDQIIARIQQHQTQIDLLIDALQNQHPELHVGGDLGPENRIEFVCPSVMRREATDIDVNHQTASLVVKQGSQPDILRLELRDFRGDIAATDVPASELSGVVFRVEEGEIHWAPHD